MPKVVKRDQGLSLEFTPAELNAFNLAQDFEYTLTPVKDKIWVLTAEQSKVDTLGIAVMELLKNKKLSDRVEGKFEKSLSAQQLARFKELIAEKKIIPFKLSKDYKLAVYKLPEELSSVQPYQ